MIRQFYPQMYIVLWENDFLIPLLHQRTRLPRATFCPQRKMCNLTTRDQVVDDLRKNLDMSHEDVGAFIMKVNNCIVVMRSTCVDGLSSSQFESAHQEVWVVLKYLRTVLSMTPDQIVEFLNNKNIDVDLHNIRHRLKLLQTEKKMSTEEIVAYILPLRTHGWCRCPCMAGAVGALAPIHSNTFLKTVNSIRLVISKRSMVVIW